MSQYVLLVSWWLLAVGRGSGLTGVTPGDHKTTTPLPHSPGPPTSTPPSTAPSNPLPTHRVNPDHSLVNTTLTFYPLHVNTTETPTVMQNEVVTRKGSVTTLSTSPPATTTVPLSLVMATVTSPKELPTKQYSTPTSNNVKSKEQVLEVPQVPQKNIFIRRKHKEPYHAERVRKLSATFRVSDPPVIEIEEEKTTHTRPLKHATLRKNYVLRQSHTTSSNRPTLRTLPGRTTVDRPLRKHFSVGVPVSSTVQPTPTIVTPSMVYNPPESDEYYSSYGEYQDLTASGYNSSGEGEAAVLPDPDIPAKAENTEVEVEADIVLPDDSLADTDLHDHDLIDSVMYIYFGSSERDERGAGRQVLIVGAVISLVAQFLTLVSVLRRLRTKHDESASLILLNGELALTVGNLVFMLGVQATGSQRRCEMVAVLLHYLHLVACCWFLVNSVFSYENLKLQSQNKKRLRPWWLVAWCGPALVVALCVVFNRRGYETHAFCWMSVARGMLYSFMAPVATLILFNTCFAVLGLRLLSVSPKVDESDQKSMRVSATLLPVFAVVWFLGVVALENSASLVFPLLFVASSSFFNWFVLACWLPADLSLWRESDDDYDEDDDEIYEEVLKTDSQPLLEEPAIYVCGRRDLCELQMDPICTISS